MSEFEHQFLQKLTELVPYDYDEVVLGTLGFNIKYTAGGKYANPLNICLFGNNQSDPPQKCQYITFPAMNHIFTKRVSQTPFYISFLMSDNVVLYILDFYIWKPVPIIYRIFYVQFSDNATSLKIQIPENHRRSSGQVRKIDSCYFNCSVYGGTDPTSKDLIINSDKNDHKDRFLVFAYSANREEISDIDFIKVLGRYNEVESISKMNHIDHFIKVQDPHIKREIDTLWNRFKGLTPDHHLDIQLAAKISEDHREGLVIKEICKLFDWDKILIELDKSLKIQKSVKKLFESNSEQMTSIVDAYLAADPDESLLLILLQRWWDRYSLPVYQLKFESMLYEFPEKLFMIYALAQWVGLPWSRLLLNRCNRFSMRTDLEFLAYLHQLIQVRIIGKNTVKVKSGFLTTGNFIQLRRGKTVIRFTRFGQKVYSSLDVDQLLVLKIDKEVSFKLDEKNQQLDILPDVTLYNAKDLYINEAVLKVDNYSIRVPLLWKKAELRHNDFRLRWIFKKTRIQFSCAKGKKCGQVTINNQDLEFKQSQWLKYYHPVKAIKPGMGLKILDSDGRSYFLTKNHPEDGMLLGWVQNRYALFVEQFNCQPVKGRQRLVKGSESGRIESTLIIPDKTKKCTITTKKYSAPVEFERINLSGILLYSPLKSRGHLIAIIEDSIQHQTDEIKVLFKKSLGFLPIFIRLTKSKGITSGNQIIFVAHKEKTQNNIENGLILRSVPFIISFSQELKEIFAEILPV